MRFGKHALVAVTAGLMAAGGAAFLYSPAAPAAPGNESTQVWSIESMKTGGLMAASNGGTTNDTEIITWHRIVGATEQAWSMGFYDDGTVRFHRYGTDRCIDVYHSNRAGSDSGLVLWDCNDTDVQRWHVDTRSNGQARLRWAKNSELCMDLKGAPSAPDDARIVLWPCNETANQRFIVTPYSA